MYVYNNETTPRIITSLTECFKVIDRNLIGLNTKIELYADNLYMNIRH